MITPSKTIPSEKRSSVESKKAPNVVFWFRTRARTPSTMSNARANKSITPPMRRLPVAMVAAATRLNSKQRSVAMFGVSPSAASGRTIVSAIRRTYICRPGPNMLSPRSALILFYYIETTIGKAAPMAYLARGASQRTVRSGCRLLARASVIRPAGASGPARFVAGVRTAIDGGGGVERGELLGRNRAGEDQVAQARLRHQPLEARTQRAIAGDDEAGVRIVLADQRDSAQQVFRAFAHLQSPQVKHVELPVIVARQRWHARREALHIDAVGNHAIVPREEARDELGGGRRDGDAAIQPADVAHQERLGRNIHPPGRRGGAAAPIPAKCPPVDCPGDARPYPERPRACEGPR